jgi:hypothetical protein
MPVVGIEGLPRATVQVVNSSVVPQLLLSMAKDQIFTKSIDSNGVVPR